MEKMRTRLLVPTVLLLSLLLSAFLLSSCTKPAPTASTESTPDVVLYTVTYQNEDGLIKTVEIPLREIKNFTPDDFTKNGRDYIFLRWVFEINQDEKTVTANAVYTMVPDRTTNPLPISKITVSNLDALQPDTVNEVLVVFVSFTDGHQVNHDEFEQLFTAEYEGTDILRSVNAYYKANSYGRDTMHFNFVYYDTGLTSSQGLHKVRDTNKNGESLGDDFVYNIVNKLKKNKAIDPTKLDADKDGFLDLVIFVTNEDLTKTDDRFIYGASSGTLMDAQPSIKNPTICSSITIGYEFMNQPLEPGIGGYSTRKIIHEVGHAFGLSDYYDFSSYEGNSISTLGCFDMHEYDYGDLNVYSKYLIGWLEPYIITDDIEEITLRLRCSSTYGDALLIPTSKGWNGTPYDEYLLIDMCAPQGATGYDWSFATDADSLYRATAHKSGGIRIYHVDSRLLTVKATSSKLKYTPLNNPTIKNKRDWLNYRFYNSNGLDPLVKGDSRFYHRIEIVPRDCSSKYRIATPTRSSTSAIFSTTDLFGVGDIFDPTQELGCFTNGSKMNNGGVIDYSIRVDEIDYENAVATITVTKLHREDAK